MNLVVLDDVVVISCPFCHSPFSIFRQSKSWTSNGELAAYKDKEQAELLFPFIVY